MEPPTPRKDDGRVENAGNAEHVHVCTYREIMHEHMKLCVCVCVCVHLMLALEALNKSVISRLLLSQGLLHFSPQLLRHLGFQFADSLHGQRVTIGPRWAQARAITARHHLSMSDIVTDDVGHCACGGAPLGMPYRARLSPGGGDLLGRDSKSG